MGYTRLQNSGRKVNFNKNSLEYNALSFIRDDCEDLSFSREKEEEEKIKIYI